MEAGDTLAFQSAKIEGELRCEKLIIDGAVWIGPRARVVVERIVFGEMTLESGGALKWIWGGENPRGRNGK